MANHSDEDLLAPRPADPVTLAPGRPPESDAKPEPLVRVTVRDGTQVALEGTVYPGGSTLDAPDSLAAEWIAYGWVTAAAKAAPPKAAPTKAKPAKATRAR